jgi:predicted Zn-dependent peptidase
MIHHVTEHTLSTGTKGLLIDVPGSEVVNILVRFNSGFQFGPADKYELSHFVEHLIADGNEDYPTDEAFKVEVTKNGAYRNAYTSPNVNGYVIECAAFELPRMLDLLIGYLGKPLFPQASFATELNNVREELNRIDTEPMKVCSINLSAAQWPQEVQSIKRRIEQLTAITLDDVESYYHRTHTAANMRFYVAGSLKGKEEVILSKLCELSELLPKGERLVIDDKQAVSLIDPITEKRDLSSIYYDLVGSVAELDQEERRAAALMRTILFGGHQGRIFGPMRKRGLAYTIGGSVTSQKGRSLLEVWGYVTKATIEPLFELITGELERLSSGDLTNTELKASQDLLLGSVTRTLQTSEDLLNWYAGSYDMWGTIRAIDDEFAAYVKVTPKEVIAVARKLTTTELHATSFVGTVSTTEAKAYTRLFEPIWRENH